MGLNGIEDGTPIPQQPVIPPAPEAPQQGQAPANVDGLGLDDDVEVIDDLGNHAGLAAELGFEEVGMDQLNGPAALQGAQVGPGAVPQTLAGRLREIMPERHTFGNWIKNAFAALGRTLMGIHHGIWGAKQLGDLQADALKHIPWGTRQTTTLPELRDPEGGRTVCTFTAEEVGAAFGLRQAVWRPFPHEANQTAHDIAFPNGVPMLADIKQDPNLQDCWFLSSLGAMIVGGGSYAIERLIELPADPNAEGAVARVKLGERYVYEVPFAEIRGGNGAKGAVSHSAPWVKILEQAMQMHRLRSTGATEPDRLAELSRGNVKMAYANPSDAFMALLGTSRMPQTQRLGNLADPKATLAATIRGGNPVVLGSPDSKLTSLSTGISPEHAVTFIDIDPDTDAAIVLDPYGKVKTVPLDKLRDFTVISMHIGQ